VRPAAASRARLSRRIARVAVFDRGGGLRDQRVLHPAVERDCGGWKGRRRASRAKHRRELRQGLAARCRDRDRKLGGFAFDRVTPMVVVIAHFEQPVARTQRTLQRRHAAGMLAVDRQHQPVEEPSPLRSRAQKQSVHRRRQPHHAQVIAEGRGRTYRLAIDPAAAARAVHLGRRRIDAGAERRKAERAFDLGGYRPGAIALIVGDILQRGAAEAAARRQERDRFQAIGFPGAVRPDQRHDIAARRNARRPIVAEMRQREPVDAGGGHITCHCRA